LVRAILAAGVVCACAFVDEHSATFDRTRVRCHLTAEGETHVASRAFTATAYDDIPLKVGSSFLFRIVTGRDSTAGDSIRLYTYFAGEAGPSLIQQVRYPVPPPSASAFGFTGLQTLHEPEWEGELQYWCELEQRNPSGSALSTTGPRQP
jgi:hypothetical protein